MLNVSCSTGNKAGFLVNCVRVFTNDSQSTVQVIFTNTTGSQVFPAGANITIKVNGFRNPTSTQWTSTFANIAIADKAGT